MLHISRLVARFVSAIALCAMVAACTAPPPVAPVSVSPVETAATPVSEAGDTSTANQTAPSPAEPSVVANADVEFVRAVRNADETWTAHVTVRHPDTGWDDYADGWDVVLPDGSVAKPDPDSSFTRLLLHPHETEQPFTRSQSGIVIPDDVTQVTVRAHDLVDGWGGREIVVDLKVTSAPGFEVQR